MYRSNSPNMPPHTPPPTSSVIPVTRRPIIPIPPSGPYPHLSESGFLTSINTLPIPPTFAVTNIPLHLRDTFAICNIVVFQLQNRRLDKNIIFCFPKRRANNPWLDGVITNIDNNNYSLEDNEGTQYTQRRHCIRKYNSPKHHTLLHNLPNYDTFGYRISSIRINSSASYAYSRNRIQQHQSWIHQIDDQNGLRINL